VHIIDKCECLFYFARKELKMKWIEKDVQTCFPVYECSKCGAEILVFDAVELPCYCKNCGEDEEK
jgi:ribosomal protein S27E